MRVTGIGKKIRSLQVCHVKVISLAWMIRILTSCNSDASPRLKSWSHVVLYECNYRRRGTTEVGQCAYLQPNYVAILLPWYEGKFLRESPRRKILGSLSMWWVSSQTETEGSDRSLGAMADWVQTSWCVGSVGSPVGSFGPLSTRSSLDAHNKC